MIENFLQSHATILKAMRKSALFLDRDGVINFDYGYVHSKEKFKFIPGIFELVQCAKKRGHKVFIITNQSGIGRGYYSDDNFWDLMNWVKNTFKLHQSHIDDIYYCPDIPPKNNEINFFRKPSPGMILKAATDYNLSLQNCILVGDKLSDIEAGKAAGIGRNILFKSDGCDCVKQDHLCVENLSEIIKFL